MLRRPQGVDPAVPGFRRPLMLLIVNCCAVAALERPTRKVASWGDEPPAKKAKGKKTGKWEKVAAAKRAERDHERTCQQRIMRERERRGRGQKLEMIGKRCKHMPKQHYKKGRSCRENSRDAFRKFIEGVDLNLTKTEVEAFEARFLEKMEKRPPRGYEQSASAFEEAWWADLKAELKEQAPPVCEADTKEINAATDVGWTADAVLAASVARSFHEAHQRTGGQLMNSSQLVQASPGTALFERLATIQRRRSVEKADEEPPPDSFDSRSQWPECTERFDHVRDQGLCGSCWAQAVAGVFEDRLCVATSGAYQSEFSATHIYSCDVETGNIGCGGGATVLGFLYAWKHGIVSGGDYPDRKDGQSCVPENALDSGALAHFSQTGQEAGTSCSAVCTNEGGFQRSLEQDRYFGSSAIGILVGTEDFEGTFGLDTVGLVRIDPLLEMKQWMLKGGSVAMGFMVYTDFLSYTTGVYGPTTTEEAGGHAVKLIGWGVGYIRGVNSWGTSWGENGQFRMTDTDCCKWEFALTEVPSEQAAGLPVASPTTTTTTTTAPASSFQF